MNRDNRIVRDKSNHTYKVDDTNYYFPVSNYINTLFNPIIYKNISINNTKDGNLLNTNIKNFFSMNPIDDNYKNEIEYKYFLKFINDNPDLKIFRQEWTIFDEDVKIAGSLDCILINSKGELFLYDWKRCKKIWFTSNIPAKYKFMQYKGEQFTNCNYWKYALQVNFYAKILEKYNIKITKLFITSFHPVNSEYINLEIPILTNVMNSIWNLRKNELK